MDSNVKVKTVKPKKKARRYSNRILRLLILLLFCFIAYTLIRIAREPVSTVTVRYGSMEDKIDVNGLILRNETVINSPAQGIISYAVREGERVNKGARVATVFEGKVDKDLQRRIVGVNERLQRLQRHEIKEELIIGDIVQIENTIAKTVESVIDATYREDTEKVLTYKNDLERILLQRAKEMGEEVPDTDKAEQLLQEKKQLESQAGYTRIDVFAPVSGVFGAEVDGLENHFDLSDFSKITPDSLQTASSLVQKNDKEDTLGETFMKMVDNYEWYYAATVDAKWVNDIQIGAYLLMRFPELSDETLDANVAYISEEVNGKVAVVLSCMQYVDNIYSARNINAEIVKKKYSGFQIPFDAIRVINESQSGVYIAKENIALFKNIDVLYKGDEYVIVKEDNNMQNGLLLYDEVIVSGRNIEEGKILR